ncbi:hypothetical protein ACLOJK_024492 [Asimina triloba]
MEMCKVSVLASAAAAVFVFFSLVWKRKKNNLPPSPPSLPVLGYCHLLKLPTHRSLAALAKRYGPILYFNLGSRPVLLVSSSSAARECFSNNDIILANRPRTMAGKYLGYNHTMILFSNYGPHWRNLRRISTSEVLSRHRIQMLFATRKQEILSLVKGLFQLGEGKKVAVELKSKFSELMFNVILRAITDTGKQWQVGENVGDTAEGRQFRRLIQEVMSLLGVSNYLDFFPVLACMDFGGIQKRMEKARHEVDGCLQRLIDDHQRIKLMNKDDFSSSEESEGGKKSIKTTLIDVLLSLKQTEADCYTDDFIKGLILALILAGTDTSALTLEWAMSHLLNNPHVLKKAQAEVDGNVGNNQLLDESDLPNLPYLQCIINETLRLCPAGPLLSPHESSEDTVIVNVWAIHRDPHHWEDPNQFKPERFEGMEAGRMKVEGFKFFPFGSGRRMCPGAGFAMRVLLLALGTLIQCFEWERVGEDEVDMDEGEGSSMPKKQPLEAFCKPRQQMLAILSQL